MFGLKNYRNNCYSNSIIQIFLNCDIFMDKLSSIDKDYPSLLFYINNLKTIPNLRDKTFNELMVYIRQNTKFGRGDQNDANEFLVKVLDIFEHENKNIYDMFVGTKISSLECKKCDYKNKVKENFNFLAWYLHGPDTFGRMLNNEFEKETIQNCKCEKCGNTELENNKYIYKFPDVFIVLNVNMQHTIQFPENLNIIDYNGEKVIYKFTGTVNHYGSLNGGHYTFSTKNKMIDDTNIIDVSFPKDFGHAYMIVYSKIKTN